jgi:predicted MPP superfamily phosphohydrolase
MQNRFKGDTCLTQKLLSRRGFILGGIGVLASAYLYFEYKAVAVKHYTVSIKNLPNEFNGFTILHLTDLHSKEYGSAQENLLRLINRHAYDLIVLTGDFIDKNNPKPEPVAALIKGLADKPVFFVPGNHEWATGFTIKDRLVSLGVNILGNQSFKFVSGASHIWLVGVDDPYRKRDNLAKALAGTTENTVKILLAHAPNIFPKAVQAGIDLTLVGHTHGGQVRLPLVGAIYAPGQGLFPQYDYGLFQKNGRSMIINGGLGESLLPIRFMNRPEIGLIKLQSA